MDIVNLKYNMLKSLSIKNFTVFKSEKIKFASGLNIFIGENGSGKTHLLKLPYSISSVSFEMSKRHSGLNPTKALLQPAVAAKLFNVFRPDTLGRLTKRKQGRERCEVFLKYENSRNDISFSFTTNTKTEVDIGHLPSEWNKKPPVYLPTRELLTIYPGFVSLYENYHLEFEETWRDTCLLLGGALSKGPRAKEVGDLLEPIEKAMGGTVVLDSNGRFYLSIPGSGNMEIPLVAEGIRKLAMLARLVANNSLVNKSSLFWDEPETNLNPKLIKIVAQVIIDLARQGVQIFIGTHSLFLMREIEILLEVASYKDLSVKVFGIGYDGDHSVIESGNTFDDIRNIASLDEELSQSDRYMGISGSNEN